MNIDIFNLIAILLVYFLNIVIYKKNLRDKELLKRRLDMYEILTSNIEIEMLRLNNRSIINNNDDSKNKQSDLTLMYNIRLINNKISRYGTKEEKDIMINIMNALNTKNAFIINEKINEFRKILKRKSILLNKRKAI